MRSTPTPPLKNSSSKKRWVSSMILNTSKRVVDNGIADERRWLVQKLANPLSGKHEQQQHQE